MTEEEAHTLILSEMRNFSSKIEKKIDTLIMDIGEVKTGYAVGEERWTNLNRRGCDKGADDKKDTDKKFWNTKLLGGSVVAAVSGIVLYFKN